MLTFEQMEAQLRGGGVRAVSAPQLFPTPPGLALRMVEGVQAGDRVLEPSAGTGALLRALPAGVDSTAVELSWDLWDAIPGPAIPICADFLDLTPERLGLFDWVIANPPFTKDKDIQHIRHMWEFLKPGGQLVTLSSVSWTFGERRSCKEFRAWLDEIGATREEIPRGTFEGTDVATVLIRATR